MASSQACVIKINPNQHTHKVFTDCTSVIMKQVKSLFLLTIILLSVVFFFRFCKTYDLATQRGGVTGSPLRVGELSV